VVSHYIVSAFGHIPIGGHDLIEQTAYMPISRSSGNP
jgi:hypothetical protein